MSSSICLSMQTCLEPLLMQPRVLGLALFPHFYPLSPSPASTRSSPPSDHILPSSLSYWDNVPVDHVACQDEGSYVHPLMRRSASALSEKSLEMCTESLGSETGSVDFLRDEDEEEIYPFFVTDQCRQFPKLKSRKSNLGRPRDFPPPLKSMTGSAVARMRPCRSDGRLVLQAVSVSSCRNSFHVERGEGRLRLSLYCEEGAAEYSREGQENQDEEEEEGSDQIGKDEERIGGGHGRRPCRCKEGEGLLNWKPCWVAT